jgi:hypothetical protein
LTFAELDRERDEEREDEEDFSAEEEVPDRVFDFTLLEDELPED